MDNINTDRISTWLPEGWRGTALDLLALDSVPHVIRLRGVFQSEILPVSDLRSFAVTFARAALTYVNAEDARCYAALDAATDNSISDDDLALVREAATNAVEEIVESARWPLKAAAWAADYTLCDNPEDAASESAAWATRAFSTNQERLDFQAQQRAWLVSAINDEEERRS